jgi:CubicO group peptidase (beta-lactamase class C family)
VPWSEALRLLEGGVGTAFPGAVLRVAQAGRERLLAARGTFTGPGSPAVHADTRWDVASLTKPMAVGTLAMRGVAEGWLDLDEPAGATLPPLAAREPHRRITLRHLLGHAAGLPDWLPLARDAAAVFPSIPPGSPECRRWIRERVAGLPLAHEPGALAVYSDLGYILLDWWLELRLGAPLDASFAERVAAPLRLAHTHFHPRAPSTIPPTERCPLRGRVASGEVHDDNAWALGGVSGHAGLFSTARDVGRWADALLGASEAGGYVPAAVVRACWESAAAPETTWRLAWDTPTLPGSTGGDSIDPTAVGHLGFTGCSVWIDRRRRATAVLLSNRVYPSRSHTGIRALRPRLHAAVWAALDHSVEPPV